MEVYSTNTSEIIRNDFTKYQKRRSSVGVAKPDNKESEAELRRSLDQLRSEMADDDGRSSFGTYKCPIF